MKITKILVVLLVGVVLPVLASAQFIDPNVGGVPKVGSLQDIISAIENAAAMIFGAIAVIAFITAGILFLTAGGQPEKIAAARSAFIWGIAGVVVGIIAFSIIKIVGSFLG